MLRGYIAQNDRVFALIGGLINSLQHRLPK